LRLKQSPIQQGDGFTAFAMTSASREMGSKSCYASIFQ